MSHKRYRTDQTCLNCQATVTGKFCSQCGQENIETRDNFFHLTYEFIADYFHFDSKFLRSTIPLITKPGFLTLEYWNGRRVRYIHPLRLYFFITIVFMVAATFFYNHLDKQRITDSFIITTDSPQPDSTENATSQQIEDPDLVKSRIRNDLQTAFDRFFHDLKYISFFLLPVYALIFRLLYIRRKGFYVDHLVYTLHLQSFVYLLVTISFLVAAYAGDQISIVRRITILIVFVYITFSLRYLYQQSWWKTVLKALISTLLLVVAMGIVLGIYFVAYSTFIS